VELKRVMEDEEDARIVKDEWRIEWAST